MNATQAARILNRQRNLRDLAALYDERREVSQLIHTKSIEMTNKLRKARDQAEHLRIIYNFWKDVYNILSVPGLKSIVVTARRQAVSHLAKSMTRHEIAEFLDLPLERVNKDIAVISEACDASE